VKLSSSAYNSIMNEYSEQRFQNEHDLDLRIRHIYEEIPRIKEINDLISTRSMECARSLISNREDSYSIKDRLKSDIKALSEEKASLLKAHGYNDDYLELHYGCEVCKDTGYIGSEECRCFKNKVIKALYQQSNIEEILKKENFNTFSTAYYSNSVKDPVLNLTPYENIHDVLNTCRDFVDNFDKTYGNMYIYGEAGVGKTFLSNCIANELISSGHSVIYLSAIRLFEMLADEKFRKSDADNDVSGITSYLYDCDLLIIDDLGTELINNFTTSQLFNIINERHLLKKSTLISSNLSIAQLKEVYAERIFSRLTTFKFVKVIGDDIRLKISLN